MTVTTVGLLAEASGKAPLPSEMVESTLCTDSASSGELAAGQGFAEAQYLVSSADELGAVIARVKGLSLPWDNLQVKDNAKTFSRVLSGIAIVEGLLNLMLTGVGLASVAILVFVLAFWMRGRTHEIGILLSVGASKKGLLIQFLIEPTLVAFIAGGLTALASDRVSRMLGGLIVG